jgi:hypothetical protein
MGVKVPFIGGENLDSKIFLDHVRQWENAKDIKKSTIATLFNESGPLGQEFVRKYKREYGPDEQPDYLSVLGYDTVVLLAHGIQLAQSTIPIEIATALRYMDACKGITGVFNYQENGDLKIKPLFFKHLVKRDYVYRQLENVKLDTAANIPVCNDIDMDHDSIPDNVDACPESTDVEKAKGVKLQGANKGCPVDTDEDDVPDYKDICPTNTQREIAYGVDKPGCPVDSDKDGIADYTDDDIDGDTIGNDIDLCPKNTAAELAYGANLTGKQLGCPIDSDADNVLDYRDSCRNNTAEEINLGVDSNGCPVDKDTDGVLDYQDKCLKSPFGVVMAAQGCEVVDKSVTEKPTALFFAANQLLLMPSGSNYLAGLLAKIDLQLLKNIQIIGYTSQKNTPMLRNQLLMITDYLLQKNVPADKVEIIIIETDTKIEINQTSANKIPVPLKRVVSPLKNNTFEFTVAQFEAAPPAVTGNSSMPAGQVPPNPPLR